jgi:hypothetical protein
MAIVDADDDEPQVTITAPCVRCGSQVSILPPREWRPDGQLAPSRPEYGATSLCLRHRLDELPAEHRPWLRAGYQSLLGEAADVGIPDGYPIWPITFTAGNSAKTHQWRGWRGHALACLVHGLPATLPERPPVGVVDIWRVAECGEQRLDLAVCQVRLWQEGIPGMWVWRPDRGRREVTLELRGWRRIERADDRKRLLAGLSLYTRIQSRGRKMDDREERCREFRSRLPAAIWKARDSLEFAGDPRHRPLRQHELATALGVHEDTLGARIRECGMDWLEIKRRPGSRTYSR